MIGDALWRHIERLERLITERLTVVENLGMSPLAVGSNREQSDTLSGGGMCSFR